MERPLKIRFREGAKQWTDALPIGNGRLGAMVWGGISSELIQLNEDTLWTGTPSDYTDSKAPEAVSEVRNLVNRQHYSQATAASSKLTGKHPSEAYQLLGDIKLEFDYSHLPTGEHAAYHRELDLDTATVKVKYSIADVEFQREHFASYPNQVIATNISATQPAKLSFTVSLDSNMFHHTYLNGNNQIIMEGTCPAKRDSPQLNPQGIQFSAILDLKVSHTNGVINILDDNNLKVEASDWAVLLLVASSSFTGPFTAPSESTRDPTSECLSTLNSITYENHTEYIRRQPFGVEESYTISD